MMDDESAHDIRRPPKVIPGDTDQQMDYVSWVSRLFGFSFNKVLLTTATLDPAIKAAAKIGGRDPDTARAMATIF